MPQPYITADVINRKRQGGEEEEITQRRVSFGGGGGAIQTKVFVAKLSSDTLR